MRIYRNFPWLGLGNKCGVGETRKVCLEKDSEIIRMLRYFRFSIFILYHFVIDSKIILLVKWHRKILGKMSWYRMKNYQKI